MGDVFQNIGDKEDIRIGAAPGAGMSVTLTAAALQRLARLNGLNWRPASREERAIIARDGVAISPEDIAEEVLLALLEKGVPTDGLSAEVMLGSRRHYRSPESSLKIHAITTDPAGRRFSAVLAVVTPGEPEQTMTITGRLRHSVEVPVLRRQVRAGEVIDDQNIQWASLPSRQVSTNAVREPSELVGQSARRTLNSGAPILISDLQRATLISKGQRVAVLVQAPGMQLSAQGVALEEGAQGDSVRVVNERSEITLQGIVRGDGTVIVGPSPGASLTKSGRRNIR
ncbi:MAG: flagellar basal body P-ring formation protein FlgA [Rhodospirillales bacterium]|nr:flagellar basal body P-ring formation protein FlgA [Rhodospirillales bacterium]